MADVNWNLLAQYPNAGEAFAKSFQQGQANNALSNMIQNPDDQKAFAGAFTADPSAALGLYNAQTERQRYSQQQAQREQEQAQARLQAWQKHAGELAKWADTPEKWDQAIDATLAHNHPDVSTQDLLALKGKFSPALRAGFMAAGGVSDDKTAEPDIQRQHDYYVSIGRPDLAEAILTNHANPQQPIQTANPDGTITVNWVRPPLPGGVQASAQHGEMPTPATPQDALKLPPGTKFTLPDKRIGTVPSGNGGQSGASPAGGFSQ